MKNIKEYNLDELKNELEALGEKKYRAEQIFKWIYVDKVKEFDEMTNLSIELREKLKQNYTMCNFKILRKQESTDGTKKYLFDVLDGNAIESVLMDSRSENLDVIFNKSITNYRSFPRGSDSYHKQYEKRMNLKGKINTALLRDYSNKKQTVNHFFDSDRAIPIWAIFESLTLGEFGTFFSCANSNVKLRTSRILHLPSNLDSDGKLTEYIIYTVKDLRNAIAHNNTIFDTRFQTSRINQRLVSLLQSETGIANLNFKYIDAYIVLIAYVLRKMGETKTSCKQFISSFIVCTDDLRSQISPNICNQILGTHQRPHLIALQNFLSRS